MSVLLVLAVAAVVSSTAGAAAFRLIRPTVLPDPVARLGLWMAAGLSVIPLLFEFVPIRFTTAVVRLLFGVALVAMLATTRWRRLIRSAKRRSLQWYACMAMLLVVIVALAALQTNGAIVAPGVDAVHHLMLTRLIIANGGLPQNLEPFISGGRLAYHWGAHANVAVIALLLGRSDPFAVSELMVIFAAFLRIVCCLAFYAAARSLFASRYAAVIAAAVAAGLSALPAALVTQGRFTQLAGVAVLPALLAVRPAGTGLFRRAVLSAILAAGVFLLQARLAVFAVVWIALAALFSIVRHHSAPGTRQRALLHVFVAAGAFLILLLPWSVRLLREPLARSMLSGQGFAQKENRWTQRYVPPQLVWLPNNGLLLSAATGGLSGVAGLGTSGGGRVVSLLWSCAVAAAVVGGLRKKDQAKGRAARRKEARSKSARRVIRPVAWAPFALLAAWTALGAAFLLLHPEAVDATNIVPYAAGILTLFIPVILAASGLIAAVARVLFPVRHAVIAAAILLVCALTGFAQRTRDAVRSPVPDADVTAMQWIRGHVPASARFAVMARPFYGIYVGEDAGYFIQVLTDRRTLLPPMIYGWVSPPDAVAKTNALLKLWTTVHPDSSVPQLMQAGVTHAYIGSSAKVETRNIMRSSPRFRILYDRDGVLISEMR